MKRSFICKVYGVVMEGSDPRSSERLKRGLKELLSEKARVPSEDVRIYMPPDVRFMDESDGIFCEVIVPKFSVIALEKIEEILLAYLGINAQVYAHF
jgi:hypothetical protein